MATVISPRTACRYLRDITDPRGQFHTTDGQTVRNLVELACYLKACGEEPFKYHVSGDHNHFSNWVDNTVLDNDLAIQMSLVLEKNPMRIIVSKRVNLLVYFATRTPRGREKARMILEDAQLPEELFLTNDGRTIRNIWELKEYLDAANDNIFSYHVTPIQNDFYEWVAGILMDFELADKIAGAKQRQEAASHVGARISQLEAYGVQRKHEEKLAEYVDSILGKGKKA